MSTVRAEWTKLRTVPGTGWLALAVVALTVPLGALAAGAMPEGGDPAKAALTGVVLGQAVVAVLAVGVFGGEYATGMIRTSLAAVPRRLELLAAKATAVTAVVLPAAAIAVLGSVLTGRILLADGLPVDRQVLRAAVGSVLYLGLVGLLSLGVAALVRDAAAAVGLVLALLYLTPIVVTLVSDPEWSERLRNISPMTAGLAVQSTVDLDVQPIAPWHGLGVLALWAAGALVCGGLALRFRDA